MTLILIKHQKKYHKKGHSEELTLRLYILALFKKDIKTELKVKV